MNLKHAYATVFFFLFFFFKFSSIYLFSIYLVLQDLNIKMQFVEFSKFVYKLKIDFGSNSLG